MCTLLIKKLHFPITSLSRCLILNCITVRMATVQSMQWCFMTLTFHLNGEISHLWCLGSSKLVLLQAYRSRINDINFISLSVGSGHFSEIVTTALTAKENR